MICPSCAEERASRNNPMKISSCKDCDADHYPFPVKCDCQLAGHDKSKIKKLNDIPKSIQSEIDELITPTREINKERSSDAKVS